MIDREQLKCMPELMALIEQEHSIDEVANVSFSRNIGSYLDERGKTCYYPLDTHTTITFTDGSVIFTDKPISYVPKSEEEQEAENEQSEK